MTEIPVIIKPNGEVTIIPYEVADATVEQILLKLKELGVNFSITISPCG